MSKLLGVSRSQVYYEPVGKKPEKELEEKIRWIFENSRKNYGSRKIKAVLKREGSLVSLRKIRIIMKKYDLVSKYTKTKYKKTKEGCNNAEVANIVNREFNDRKPLEVIISDLTYVRVLSRWAYVCLILDLANREIVGHSAGNHREAGLIEKAFRSIKYDLSQVEVFHSDRGKEFDNYLIDEVLEENGIIRSLSKKGSPYDNAVAEATYRIFKTEFCQGRSFESLEELEAELFDYVNWYNNIRIHGSLNYMTPMEYKTLYMYYV